ncbi:MAG: GmrSD restriction endonuclease domain-containing protein [Metamycoplasmataceae bacterium]
MINSSDKKIVNDRIKCRDLLNHISDKKIFVPNFQREYVWSKAKIIEFLNSQLKVEPFGTILLWSPKQKLDGLETRNEFVKLLSSKYKNHSPNSDYLIDGQQRTTSLLIIFYSLEIYDFFKNKGQRDRPTGWNYGTLINFNYIKGEFTLDKMNENTISLSEVFGENFDLSKLKDTIKAKKPLLSDDEIYKLIIDINTIRTKVENFEISVIRLLNHKLDAVIDIFSNINTKGAKLSNFDLIHAKWSNLDDQLEKSKFNFEKGLTNLLYSFDYGYDKIDKEVFVDSLYLHIDEKPKYSSEEKIGFPIKKEDSVRLINKFNENLEGFKKTYEFLKGMKMNHKFLPSKIIFKWLTYYFVKTKKQIHGSESAIIKNYIKLASINDRYRSSSNERLKEDIDFVDNVLLNENVNKSWDHWKNQAKNRYFERHELTPNILENVSYKTNSMISNYIKFILLSTTRSFFEGKHHTNIENVDMHHIFPKNSKIADTISSKENIENIVNTTPLSSIENKHIGNKNPSTYLQNLRKNATKDFDEILIEHGINIDHLENDDFESFFNERSQFIINKVNESFNF